MSKVRTELQQEVVNALVESKAIDFEAVGVVLGKFGARAALNGDAVGALIHPKCWDICIPPFFAKSLDLEQSLPGQAGGS